MAVASTPATQWSVRQWAVLGAHPTQAVRDWCNTPITITLRFVRADKANALRLLGSTWADTRSAIDYFNTRFEASDWEPTCWYISSIMLKNMCSLRS